ncbi:MAG: bacillithiol biosynthesis cysteine-adding enzyme BshC [Planctomycetota bacterium]
MNHSDAVFDVRYPRLVRDYVRGTGGARALFAHAPDRDGLLAAAAAAAAARKGGIGPELTAILIRQNQSAGAPFAVMEAITALGRPDSLAVVTGQQPGLFGGPLYVAFKVIRAVHAAAELARATGWPVVPVYWLGTDDHDFAEVDHTTVVDAEGHLRRIEVAPARPAEQPAGATVIDDSFTAAVRDLVAALRPTEFTPALKALLEDGHVPGRTFGEAGLRLAVRLYGQLSVVVLDPMDPAFRTLMRPVLERACAGMGAGPLAEAARAVTAAGYEPQVRTEEGRVHAFAEREGLRVALFRRGTCLCDRDGKPVDISRLPLTPHVLSRSLCQDAVFPTAAYVAGPGEIGYFTLMRGIYAAHNIPMPVILPRYMGTLIDERTARYLDALRMEAEPFILAARDVAVHEVFRRHTAADPTAVVDTMTRLADSLVDGVRQLFPSETGDKAFEADLRDLSKGVEKQFDALTGGMRKRSKERHETALKRAAALSDSLNPGGELQERTFNLFPFMNLFGGAAFVAALSEKLRGSAEGHNLWRI